MAQFHIGQRVRINIPHGYIGEEKNGLETVITGPRKEDWLAGAYYPTAITDAQGKRGIVASCLAPLTDPLAEKFIASIKALGPLKEDRPLGEILREKLGLS